MSLLHALHLQRRNPGLPNATYVNYLVDPESSQLYLQMPSGRRPLPPQSEDGYGSGMYGYQPDSNAAASASMVRHRRNALL